ncbi:cytochrome P450 monooxygenase-like protein [Phaeosphaeriaceae sp. PMI808]|nr:cytochrome P450 monooxygenase-like protein [Phaeosphaeriaceae sp. PMI808]
MPFLTTPSSDFRLSSATGIILSGGLFVSFVSAYFFYTVVYNIFFHPLKHIPGPLVARSCPLPYAIYARSGLMVDWVKKQHDKYGDAVRLAPNELSFISGETAWQDIYGFRTGKHRDTGAYLKDRSWYSKPLNGVYSLLASNEADHSRMRRNLSHAFSDKALRDQEPLVQAYVDLLIHRLGEHAAKEQPIDMTRWYNYTTFDIICDLTFGEPLYCLRDGKEHMWIQLVYNSVKSVCLLAIRLKYPVFQVIDKIQSLFVDTRAVNQARKNFDILVHEKVERRLEQGPLRPDFFSHLAKNQASEAKALTRNEMDSNAILFLVAGSETTATTLSGTTYLLLKNPSKYAALVHEIRTKFSSADQITIDEVNKLDYMIACLQEGLRLYPPVATGFPRVVPAGGDHISGRFVPGGTAVYVSQHATNHSARNYRDPGVYAPERWMGDEKYAGDKRETFNPFSFGPRNCLGKNLAYAEMRLIVAKVLFNFDLELVDKENDWMQSQRVFVLWEKPSLMVRLKAVRK